MDAVKVKFRYDIQEKIIPLSFIWRGNTYFIESIGRDWQDETGQHILVMVERGEVFELIQREVDGKWSLSGMRSPDRLA